MAAEDVFGDVTRLDGFRSLAGGFLGFITGFADGVALLELASALITVCGVLSSLTSDPFFPFLEGGPGSACAVGLAVLTLVR